MDLSRLSKIADEEDELLDAEHFDLDNVVRLPPAAAAAGRPESASTQPAEPPPGDGVVIAEVEVVVAEITTGPAPGNNGQAAAAAPAQPPVQGDTWNPPALGDEITVGVAQRQAALMEEPDLAAGHVLQPASASYGTASHLGSILGSLVSAPGRVVASLAGAVAEQQARRQAAMQAAQLMEAESSIAEAMIASEAAGRATDALLRDPNFGELATKIEDAARKRGVPKNDIVREMGAGGRHADLGVMFDTALSNPRVQQLHDDALAAMKVHDERWSAAVTKVVGAGGDYLPLWDRLKKKTQELVEKGGGVPAEKGRSFSDLAKGLCDRIANTLRRVFRLDGRQRATAAP